MPNFNSPPYTDRLGRIGGAGVAVYSLSDICYRGFRKVAHPVDVFQVFIVLICAANKVCEYSSTVVSNDRTRKSYRTDRTGLRTGCPTDVICTGHPQWFGNLVQCLCFYAIELMIAAENKCNNTTFSTCNNQRLNCLMGLDREELT